eukprot:1686157-Amphidinium_carterae.1
MFAGQQRVLIQGAVSQPVAATHDMVRGCGHAVGRLHAKWSKLCRVQVLKSLTAANVKVNLTKTVVICNGANDMCLLMKACVEGRRVTALRLKLSTCGLGVDTQCTPWAAAGRLALCCAAPAWNVVTFPQAMMCVRVDYRYTAESSRSIVLDSMAEVGGMSAAHMNAIRISARIASGKGASDPQVTADLNTYEADHLAKWDSVRVFCAEVAATQLDIGGLETGLSTQTVRQLKKVDEGTRSALNAALLCFSLEISAWARILERRQVELLPGDPDVPLCVKLHGLLLAGGASMDLVDTAVIRTIIGALLVATLTPRRESGYCKQSVYRAEFFSVVLALSLELRNLFSLSPADRPATAQGRHRDLEKRAFAALPSRFQGRWMIQKVKRLSSKAWFSPEICVDMVKLNIWRPLSTAEHAPLEPDASRLDLLGEQSLSLLKIGWTCLAASCVNALKTNLGLDFTA